MRLFFPNYFGHLLYVLSHQPDVSSRVSGGWRRADAAGANIGETGERTGQNGSD